jgi:hypothetical protein
MCQRCVCVDLTWRRSTEYNKQKWRRSLQGSAMRSFGDALSFAECSCQSPCHIRHWSKRTFMCALAASVLPRGASYCRTLNLANISLELSTNSGMTTTQDGSVEPLLPELHYIQYDPDKEAQYLTAIRELISKDLSEPYSIYVYRYFLYQWADLCYMVS